MSSARWLNLILWGLGERNDGNHDRRSDLLMVVDVLVWIGFLGFGLKGTSFFTFWLFAPVFGQPVYWLGTQLIVGFLMTTDGRKATRAQPKATPPAPASSEPAGSEEP